MNKTTADEYGGEVYDPKIHGVLDEADEVSDDGFDIADDEIEASDEETN